MGHTKPDALKDLGAEFDLIRSLSGIKEKSPGTFYFNAIPFVHFHDKDGERWVDLKVNQEWKKSWFTLIRQKALSLSF